MNKELQAALTKFLCVITEILIAEKDIKPPKKGKSEPVEDEDADDSDDTSKQVDEETEADADDSEEETDDEETEADADDSEEETDDEETEADADDSEEETDDEETEADADDSEEETDDEETDENSEGPTREDVIDAIKAYVGKNKKGEREKAVALLKKRFGTGNVQKLEEEHFESAIKLFSK